jgi:hypothetical protein
VGEPLVLALHAVTAASGRWAKAADKPRTVNAAKMATYFDVIWVPPKSKYIPSEFRIDLALTKLLWEANCAVVDDWPYARGPKKEQGYRLVISLRVMRP